MLPNTDKPYPAGDTMGPNGGSNHSPSNHTSNNGGINGGGSFRELSPREFLTRTEMVVVLIRGEGAEGEFGRFRQVISVPTAHDAEITGAALDPSIPLGLVCPDGDCSSRTAVRLARLGREVFHLSGGLREWRYQSRTFGND